MLDAGAVRRGRPLCMLEDAEKRWEGLGRRLGPSFVGFVLSSPTLPLPVELVAGGEGRPGDEPGPGLGGSGSLGRSEDAVLDAEEEASEPMKMADRGRSLRESCERRVIGRGQGLHSRGDRSSRVKTI